MSAETAKVLEENKDRILAAGGLADKVANLENAVYSQNPNMRPPPKSPRGDNSSKRANRHVDMPGRLNDRIAAQAGK
jgi:hypothetical protein